MAKYLTEFNTYAEYSAATLSLPNVSLIKSTGKVYYKNLFAGASLGDILMWDNVNNKLVTTFNGNWDSTTYPIAQYEPIAINVYPAAQTSDGKSRYMALRWASNASDTGSTTAIQLMWGNNSTTAGDITSTDQTALNGRENTNKVVAIMPNTSGNTQAEFPIFYAVNRFRTNGTYQGDWYVPSKAELSLYHNNHADINAKIQAIKNASSSIVNTVYAYQWSSTENSTNQSWLLKYDGSLNYNVRGSNNGIRGMIAL
jgi:hypothetical protein